MTYQPENKLIEYLVEEVGVSSESIQLALRQPRMNTTVLPMVLWQYGLFNLQQLEKIWDWLEAV